VKAIRPGTVRDRDESNDLRQFTGAGSKECRRRRDLDWDEVALEFASRTGEVLTPNQARHIGDKAIVKLRKAWAEIGGAA
jgi:hypothetical protein